MLHIEIICDLDCIIKIKHFTLVNIIAGKEVIQELVASRFTQANVEKELRRLLSDTTYRKQMLQEYQLIHASLGTESAPNNAANIITNNNHN